MAAHWHWLTEYIPLVSMVSGNQASRFEFKDLIGSLVVGVASAIFASYITIKELSVEMRHTTQQLSAVYLKLDALTHEHQDSRERLTRLEEQAAVYHRNERNGMNGMNGGRK